MVIDQFKYRSFFNLHFSCSGAQFKENIQHAKRQSLKSRSHSIDIFKLEEPINLPKRFNIDGFWGWGFFVEKLNDISEPITFTLQAKPISEDYETDIATGERLIASEIYSDDWVLYLGTEDEESLFYRSKDDLSFPDRFSRNFSYSDNFWFELIDRNDSNSGFRYR